ncbi:phosphatidate cytidylyltransferase [Streptacidiphilus neutrinimicus]|uniref:phosphatidate cytidylyltransferase n=1 Tax=Streptacidiphilus neutrinimicus TaxID=105420 RepID=UPI000A003750|nr:phosphatidate cytidylyltransferase [Streptacidiphilus neutrinimicus]
MNDDSFWGPTLGDRGAGAHAQGHGLPSEGLAPDGSAPLGDDQATTLLPPVTDHGPAAGHAQPPYGPQPGYGQPQPQPQQQSQFEQPQFEQAAYGHYGQSVPGGPYPPEHGAEQPQGLHADADMAHTQYMPPVPPAPEQQPGGPAQAASGGPGAPAPKAPEKSAPKAGRDLRAAVGVGLGLGAVILASLFVVKWLFVGVVVAAVSVGMWELTTRLTEAKGIRVPLIPLLVGGAAMEVAAYLGGPEAAVVALALTSLAVLVWRMTEPPENYLRDVTAGIFTAFYVPFLATFVMLMLAAHDGPQRVALFLVLTICSDTGAYAAGSRFGKHKLAPRISPGKTREGLAGGVLLCMIAGAAGMQLMITDGSWWQGLVLGACVAVSATLGDLGESMIKRDLGIKDMGTLLPGHGGIMDRLDSLLPTAPVVWLVLVGFVGAG